MTILVRAAAGLKVPMEGNPHRYIDEYQAIAVEESAYYLRCLEYGDLVREPESDPQNAKGDK